MNPPPGAAAEKTPALLDKTLFWSPGLSEWKSPRTSKNSSLRIALVAEERLAQGLAFEGEVLLLTPQNWRRVLQEESPDLLLVESVLASSTGHWSLAQHPASALYPDMVGIVELARRLAVPSAFWITKGHEYHEHYRDLATRFDLVCCADPREVELLEQEGTKARLLLPCVQPAQFNPFRPFAEYAACDVQILYDGWADLDRLQDRLDVLQQLKPFGLQVVESRYELFRNRTEMLPEYREQILGCIAPRLRPSVLKYARCYATLEETLSTRTSQQWRALEAAACRSLVVHQGRLPRGEGDVRRDFAVECASPTDFVVEFMRCREDDLYRQRLAHRGWRAVNQRHTFAHRLRALCGELGLRHDWVEHPRATLVAPTYRKELLPRCLRTYDQIRYPDKELVLVYNGDAAPAWSDLGLEGPREDVKLTHIPRELFAGAALNLGHLHATGEYVFRIDDDDHYAPNYVADMILQARSVDADLFGKPSAPLVFEGDKAVHVKKRTTPFALPSMRQVQRGRTWIGGNSIAGRRRFFEAHPYSTHSYGAADTDLVLGLPPQSNVVVALMDPFNMAAERRSSLGSHTWKVGEEALKANRYVLNSFQELVV